MTDNKEKAVKAFQAVAEMCDTKAPGWPLKPSAIAARAEGVSA